MQKLQNFIKLFLLVGVLNSSLYAVEIGKTFDAKMDGDELVVTSKSMSYYFMRFVSADGQKSGPVLIQRNDKKVKYDIGDSNITWNGIVPTVSYKAPDQWASFSRKDTKVSPSSKLPTWKNSTLEFQGANLLDISSSWAIDKTSTIGLLLLNSTVALSIAADTATGLKDADIAPKLLKNLDKLAFLSKLDANIQKINFYYTLNSVSLDLADKILANTNNEDTDLRNAIVAVKDNFAYIDTIIKNVASVTGKLKVDEEQKTKYFNNILEVYNSKAPDASVSTTDAFANNIIGKYKVAQTDKNKESVILDLFLSSINEGIVAYEKSLTKDELKNQKKNLQIGKLVVAILAFTNNLVANDLKTDYKKGLNLLTETGMAAVGYMSSELLNNPASSVNALMDGRTKKAIALKKSLNAVNKGVAVGSAIGNQLLPFLYDFTMGKNIFKASMIDGKVSMYGYLQNNFEVFDSDAKRIFQSSLTSDNHTIYAKKGEQLHANVFMKQESVFDDNDRSLWRIKDYISPSLVYNVKLLANGATPIQMGICAKKSYFSSVQFSNYTYADSHIVNCYDTETFDDSQPGITLYNEDTLPQRNRLHTLSGDAVVSMDFSLDTTVNPLLVMLQGYETTLQAYHLNFVDISNLKIAHTLSEDLVSTLSLNLAIAEGDAVKNVYWNFGDGTTAETTTLQTQHSYYSSDIFDVKVTVTTQQGATIEYSQKIRSDQSNNTPPTFTSANSASVNENQTNAIVLQATSEVSTVTYSISGGDSTAFDLDATTGEVTFKTAPDYESGKTTYSFTATATDTASNATTQDVTIHILDVDETLPNNAPVANAGADQAVAVNALVNLDGSKSSDTDGDTLTYNWSITSKPSTSNASLTNAATVSPSFVPDVAGEYTISLVVNDGEVDSVTDTMVVTVNTNNKIKLFSGDNYNIQIDQDGYLLNNGKSYLVWSNGIYSTNSLYNEYDNKIKLSISLDGTNWKTQNIFDTEYGSSRHKIAINKDGIIYIVYNEPTATGTYGGTDINLVVITNKNGTFQKTILETGSGYSFYTPSKLFFTPDGTLHLFYQLNGWYRYNAPLYSKELVDNTWGTKNLISDMDYGVGDPDDDENMLLSYNVINGNIILYISSGYFRTKYHGDTHYSGHIWKYTEDGDSFLKDELLYKGSYFDIKNDQVIYADVNRTNLFNGQNKILELDNNETLYSIKLNNNLIGINTFENTGSSYMYHSYISDLEGNILMNFDDGYIRLMEDILIYVKQRQNPKSVEIYNIKDVK